MFPFQRATEATNPGKLKEVTALQPRRVGSLTRGPTDLPEDAGPLGFLKTMAGKHRMRDMGCMSGMTPFPRWTESLPVFTTSSLRKQVQYEWQILQIFSLLLWLGHPLKRHR